MECLRRREKHLHPSGFLGGNPIQNRFSFPTESFPTCRTDRKFIQLFCWVCRTPSPSRPAGSCQAGQLPHALPVAPWPMGAKRALEKRILKRGLMNLLSLPPKKALCWIPSKYVVFLCFLLGFMAYIFEFIVCWIPAKDVWLHALKGVRPRVALGMKSTASRFFLGASRPEEKAGDGLEEERATDMVTRWLERSVDSVVQSESTF